MKSLGLGITIICICSGFILYEYPTKDCEVLLAAISGNYEGDCKRGKAHGEGKATGKDTYEGEFKKGLPDGNGKYTWSNGNYYEGEWKDGVKEGEGKLVIKRENVADSVVTGFWEADEYFGKYKQPYVIGSNSPNISKIQVIKKGATPKQVNVSIMRMNRAVNISNLNITSNNGNFFSNQFVVEKFPFEAEIEFNAAAATGFGSSNERFNCEVDIMEQGNWTIIINLVNV